LGYLRAGHYLVETGIEHLSGSTQTTSTKFLPPAGSFNLGRRFGISSEHLFANDRIRWFGGFFQGQDITTGPGTSGGGRFVHLDNQGYILNTRLTVVPYYSAGGRNLLHFGGHYSYVDAPMAIISMHSGGNGWSIGNTLRATAGNYAGHHHRSGLELAYQRGPFGIMSEAYFARYGYGASSGKTAKGASLELTYFLTGDHRNYNLATGTLGAVNVKRPLVPFKSGDWNLVRGTGAWQVFTEYGYVDLCDWRAGDTAGNRYGGYQHDLTVGMNWFWTPNLRWVLEYTHSQQNTGSDRKYCYQDTIGKSVRINW
jgi:phosphate-selective porin OprO/OprP